MGQSLDRAEPAGRPEAVSRADRADRTEIRRIVVGIDGSANAAHALHWALGLAARFDAEVVAVHAVGLLSRIGGGPPVPSHLHQEALRRAFETEWCAPLRDSGLRYRTMLVDGPPGLVLLRTAADEEADLVVLGSRGVGGFAELMLGSTSHQVAGHSDRPVVIVPDRSASPAPGAGG